MVRAHRLYYRVIVHTAKYTRIENRGCDFLFLYGKSSVRNIVLYACTAIYLEVLKFIKAIYV